MPSHFANKDTATRVKGSTYIEFKLRTVTFNRSNISEAREISRSIQHQS